MKCSIFSLSQYPDQSQRVEGLDGDFEQYLLAEQLGYDCVWLAEHLFSSYGIIASGQVLAAAIARATKRIRVGTAVSIIPFNHPLRTAADFAAVDCLSHGRLNFGVGRAYQLHEFANLGLPMEKSREMFDEGMDIILKAWTQLRFDYSGWFWKFPELESLPRPVQLPHPPIYLAAVTPPSFADAARNGWNVLMASPFSYRIYREKWVEEQEKQCQAYDRTIAERGYDRNKLERCLMVPFHVAKSEASAKDLFSRHVEWFYQKVASLQAGTGEENAKENENKVVPGYELSMEEGRKTAQAGLLRFDWLRKHKAVIAGEPAACIDALQELKERLGLTEIILWFNLGGMPNDGVQKSMRLAAEKVMPYV